MQLPAIPTSASVDIEPLGNLLRWPTHSKLRRVDLDLTARNRVSALPWRGQFSPELVARLLTALAQPDDNVLDPFVGSGTTLLEAARLGMPSRGVDVNPAAVAFARSAQWAALSPSERAVRFEQLRNAATELAEMEEGKALALLASTDRITDLHSVTLLAGCVNAMEDGLEKFAALVRTLPSTPVAVEAGLGDARRLNIADGTFKFLLTSPPYINVFNYHQYGRPLTDRFGWAVLSAARKEIGSNRSNRQNRFRTVVQYSVDMALALQEFSRVVPEGGAIVLVVGRESQIRGVPFFNSEILARVSSELEIGGRVYRAERVFVNRYGQRIYEDILVLKNVKRVTIPLAAVVAVGRQVGATALRETLEASSDRADEVGEALEAAPAIAPSPGSRYDDE